MNSYTVVYVLIALYHLPQGVRIMISEERMATMSKVGLHVIGSLMIWMIAIIAAAVTPPVHAQHAQEKGEWTFSNKNYELSCTDKTRGACEKILHLLKYHDQEAERIKEERTKRLKREQEEETERMRSSSI